MSLKNLKEIKKVLLDSSEIISELIELEDGEMVDYSEIVVDYKWLKNTLNHRLITLRNRKK